MSNEVLNLKETASVLYPFAFCLLPDEFMAEQLIIDSLSRYVIEIEDIDELNLEVMSGDQLVQLLYLIAKERLLHFSIQNKHCFYRELSMEVRTVLFLHFKWSWNFERIATLMNCTVSDVIVYLEEGKGILPSSEYYHL